MQPRPIAETSSPLFPDLGHRERGAISQQGEGADLVRLGYVAFRDAMSMEKRYFTSDLASRGIVVGTKGDVALGTE